MSRKQLETRKTHLFDQVNKNEYKYRSRLLEQYEKGTTQLPISRDLYKVPHLAAMFSKALPHDSTGKVDAKNFYRLYKGVNISPSYLDKLELGGKMKLVSPSCIFNYEMFGPAKTDFKLPTPPLLQSAETAADMVEVYAMSLVRDVPFSQYKNNALINRIVQELNLLQSFTAPKINGKVTVDTLFRGNSQGDLIGPYISQFLYQPFIYGIGTIEQKYSFYAPQLDYMTQYDKVLSAQNGNVMETLSPQRTPKRYILNLRDGASYVHVDEPCQAALNAALILYSLKVPPNKGIPQYSKEVNFVDYGKIDLFDLIHRVTRLTFLSAWYYKWSYFKVRPEAIGLLVHNALTHNNNEYCLHSDLINSPLLPLVHSKYGSYLLSQTYPEGSPAHPAYPSGHAAIAGAAITIVKAFFDCEALIDEYVPNVDGSTLIKTGQKLKVGHELDKLASNIAILRNASGVHYRCDSAGVELGESIAISVLQEAVKRYRGSAEAKKCQFQLRKRNGEEITIK